MTKTTHATAGTSLAFGYGCGLTMALCAAMLIRYWRVDAVRATAVISVLSLCISVPVYLVYRGPTHLMNLPFTTLAVQGFVQVLVQAVITIIAYSSRDTAIAEAR